MKLVPKLGLVVIISLDVKSAEKVFREKDINLSLKSLGKKTLGKVWKEAELEIFFASFFKCEKDREK